MKKELFLVVLAVLLTFGSVFAQGIQVIGSDQQNFAVESFDDIKIGDEFKIDDWGIIRIIDDLKYDSYYDGEGYQCGSYDGIEKADEIGLYINIINLSLAPKDFLKDVNVIMNYNDQYEINGYWQESKKSGGGTGCVYEKNRSALAPFFEGFFWFGAKVPDYIVNDSKPLRLEITIDDVELTYYIRK